MTPADARLLFSQIHPDFFAGQAIRTLPPDAVFDEMILDLKAFHHSADSFPCPPGITFGFLLPEHMDGLVRSVRSVDPGWVQYFTQPSDIFCAFEGNEILSFCILDSMGTVTLSHGTFRIAGPGCVGTIPSARRRGIGLALICRATALLQSQGYDYSYIHYTTVSQWYAKLGYQTILRWNASGLIPAGND